MASNGRPSFAKRQKEMARQEKQRDKAAKRAQRATDNANNSDMEEVVSVDENGNVVSTFVPRAPSQSSG